MKKVIFVSTVHLENGKCNHDELHTIIEAIRPEVIFLEALDETYSDYQKSLFSSFGVFHKKLEIKAIQKYLVNNAVEYIPVLDNGLSDAFEKKYNVVCQNPEFQTLLDNFDSLSGRHGFQFLNSSENIKLQDEMRMLENRILGDNNLNKAALEEIDSYENSMIRNISRYCRDNHFSTSIFMFGVAHRGSLIEKIKNFDSHEKVVMKWTFFGISLYQSSHNIGFAIWWLMIKR